MTSTTLSRVYREAIAATSTDHPSRAWRLANLGAALRARFERAGDRDDLDQAVEVGRAAAALMPADHQRRAGMPANLAAVLRARFERAGDRDDLDQAVEAGRAAAALMPADQTNRVSVLSILGNALTTRFERTGDFADLDEAVSVGRHALAAVPADHPRRARYLSNLANVMRIRYGLTVEVTDLDQAVLLGQEAVTAIPAGHPDRAGVLSNLATALEVRFERGGRTADRRRAMRLARQGTMVLTAPAMSRTRCGRQWAALAAAARRWSQARRAWDQVLDILPQLVDHGLPPADRRHHLERLRGFRPARGRGGRPGGAAPPRRRPMARDPPADTVPAGVRALRTSATMAQLRDAAGDGTVVAVNVSVHGSDALLLTARGSSHLPLPALSHSHATVQANRFVAAVHEAEGMVDSAVIFEVLAWLWDAVCAPVLRYLGHERTPEPGQRWPHVWWIPTGALSTLPLHAAGHHSDPATTTSRVVLDRVVSSYTPTVRTLLHARQRHESRQPQPLGDREGSLVIGVNRSEILGATPLVSAEEEATTVHALVGAGDLALLGRQATHEKVVRALPAAGWAHLACHASADQADPADSHLVLHDRRLTVRELGDLDIKGGHLAYLSACTTATGSIRLPDEQHRGPG